jgi:two-component system sensor histidine kinase UhpB
LFTANRSRKAPNGWLDGLGGIAVGVSRCDLLLFMNSANPVETRADKPARLPLWQKAVLFAVAYFCCAEAGSYLSARGSTYVSFWLPAGLYVAALLLSERRDWLWLALAALPANVAFDLLHGTKFVVILCFYCANTIQAVTGAWLVSRFVDGRPTLRTLKEFVGLVGFAGVLSPMFGATVGAATLIAFDLSQSFAHAWKLWWGGEAMAVLIFSSLLLAWAKPANGLRRDRVPPKRILELVLLVCGMVAVTWHTLVAEGGIMSPNKGLMIPFLLWAALRFGVRGATAVVFLLSLVMAFLTTHFMKGLTAENIASGDYIFTLQINVAVAALVALIPAIMLGERDRTMAELRESEERFRNLGAAAFEGIGISENGRVVDVNDQILKMLGYERSEVIGRPVVDLVAPESRDGVAEAIRSGREAIYEHRLLRKDGSSFLAEARAQVVRVGNRTFRMTALRDITARKQAEKALRESEERLRAVIQNTPNVAIQLYDARGRILFWNQASEIVYGWKSAETIGKTLGELIFTPEDGDAFIAGLDQIQRTGQPAGPVELKFHRRDGTTGVCLSTIFRIPASGGGFSFVCMDVDISERKNAEEAIRQVQLRELRIREEYTRQLISSQEAERRRIAGELHDSLGQNLLLIKNRAQLALSRTDASADTRHQFENISEMASEAIAEVRQISHDLHPHQLDILGLTRAIEAMIGSAAQASGVAIERKLDAVDDVFSADAATHLYRVVQECLTNALKHAAARSVWVELERDVRHVRLWVKDNGCGFKQGQASPDGQRGGLGLKNIAERVRILHGELRINSTPETGTAIEVLIPIPGDK